MLSRLMKFPFSPDKMGTTLKPTHILFIFYSINSEMTAGLKKLFVTIPILADSGFFKSFLYQDGVKSTVFWVFEDLKFKISEGYDQFGSEPSEILN